MAALFLWKRSRMVYIVIDGKDSSGRACPLGALAAVSVHGESKRTHMAAKARHYFWAKSSLLRSIKIRDLVSNSTI